jgi:hypothetical protein
MRALFIILPLVVAAPVRADDTFEAKASGAQRISRIENVVWALTARCDAGDDTQQRQCRRVRDTRAAELAGATLLVDADQDAFDVGAFSAQKKSVPLKLSACIRCAGVELDGKTYFVVAAKDGSIGAKLKGGRLDAVALHDNAKQVSDENAAKAFAKSVANARVQMLVKVPAKPKTTIDGKPVLALDLVGYRVYSPCDGSVVLASPKSSAASPDKKQCGVIAHGNADAPAVDVLTSSVVAAAMQPVVDAAKACFARLGVAGKAKLALTVLADGSVVTFDQQGDFVGTPTGQCVAAAMTKASFPRSKKPKTSISFPLQLQ